MQNQKLFKISLIISLIGTFSLLLILEYQEIPFYNLKDITKEQLETKVRVQVNILSVKETPGLYLLKITDETKVITTIVFKEDPINLKKNSLVEIEGKVQEYQDELELIADKITELK
tara:strand:- start:3444 stop:3794 length:351 start_codon:yes stop_codon:yes gene_type:complete